MTSADRLKEYERLFQESQSYNIPKWQEEFKKGYGEATNYNQDLIGQRAESIGQAQALPSELRAQYAKSAIRNPLEQEALIAQRRGGVTSDIARLTDLLSARGSRYEDVLRSHSGIYEADMQRAQQAAENAWRMYQDILAQEEAERARQEAEASRRAAAAAAQQQAAELASLFSGGQGGGMPGGVQGDDLDITVTQPKPRANITNQAVSALQRTSNPVAGYDLTNWRNMGNRDRYLGAMSAINPLTQFKTLFGGIGNVVGNWKNDDMTFWQKLINSRR